MRKIVELHGGSIEVARCVRANTRLRQPRLVALAGWGQEDDRRRTRDAGFDANLVKPVR